MDPVAGGLGGFPRGFPVQTQPKEGPVMVVDFLFQPRLHISFKVLFAVEFSSMPRNAPSMRIFRRQNSTSVVSCHLGSFPGGKL